MRGGNGYMEDRVNSRVVRNAHLGALWEGISNIDALDVTTHPRFPGNSVVSDKTSATEPLPSKENSHEAAMNQWHDKLPTCSTTQRALSCSRVSVSR